MAAEKFNMSFLASLDANALSGKKGKKGKKGKRGGHPIPKTRGPTEAEIAAASLGMEDSDDSDDVEDLLLSDFNDDEDDSISHVSGGKMIAGRWMEGDENEEDDVEEFAPNSTESVSENVANATAARDRRLASWEGAVTRDSLPVKHMYDPDAREAELAKLPPHRRALRLAAMKRAEKAEASAKSKSKEAKRLQRIADVAQRQSEADKRKREALGLPQGNGKDIRQRTRVPTVKMMIENDPARALSLQLSAAEVDRRTQELAEMVYLLKSDAAANASLLDPLHSLCHHPAPEVQALAVQAQAQVYCSGILPSYRLQELPEGVKLSKGVEERMEGEAFLLKCYTRFIAFLTAAVACISKKKNARKGEKAKAAMVTIPLETPRGFFRTFLDHDERVNISNIATTALVRVYKREPSFNLGPEIMGLLVQRLGSTSNKAIRDEIVRGFRDVLQDDLDGVIGVPLLEYISRHVKQNMLHVHPDVLRPLNAARITETLNPDEIDPYNPMANMRLSKLERNRIGKQGVKDLKAKSLLEREFLDANDKVAIAFRVRQQTRMVSHMFFIYFRIVRAVSPPPKPELLAAALRGLSTYAHHISVDFMSNLYQCFEDFLAAPLPPSAHLQVIKTAFNVSAGEGASLTIDLTSMYTGLFHTIPRAARIASSGSYVNSLTGMPDPEYLKETQDIGVLMIETVEASLARKRVPPLRAAAMARQLLITAASAPPGLAVSAIRVVRRVAGHYPTIMSLVLDDNNESTSLYMNLTDQISPDHCQALSTPCWEMTRLARHWHPAVANEARSVLAGSKLTALAVQQKPKYLARVYNLHSGAFTPSIKAPKLHPNQKEIIKAMNAGHKPVKRLRCIPSRAYMYGRADAAFQKTLAPICPGGKIFARTKKDKKLRRIGARVTAALAANGGSAMFRLPVPVQSSGMDIEE